MTRLANKPSPTRIGDLRAGLRAAREKPAFERAPPKPKKRQPKGDTAEDRAEKAERQAQAQHTTSLLAGGDSKKRYVRVGERPEKKGTALGFLFQVVLVMGVAGAALSAMNSPLRSVAANIQSNFSQNLISILSYVWLHTTSFSI